jgi:tripartite-type tricarboxylate transporter receptor subunit TctC
MRELSRVLSAMVMVAGTWPALAQDYPTRPVRVIATSSAGGTSDIFMRALAEELHKRLGQPFIVENRPGGAFNIGARACAEAPPDGYTLCIIPGEPLVFNQFLYKTLASIRRTASSRSRSCSSSPRRWW